MYRLWSCATLDPRIFVVRSDSGFTFANDLTKTQPWTTYLSSKVLCLTAQPRAVHHLRDDGRASIKQASPSRSLFDRMLFVDAGGHGGNPEAGRMCGEDLSAKMAGRTLGRLGRVSKSASPTRSSPISSRFGLCPSTPLHLFTLSRAAQALDCFTKASISSDKTVQPVCARYELVQVSSAVAPLSQYCFLPPHATLVSAPHAQLPVDTFCACPRYLFGGHGNEHRLWRRARALFSNVSIACFKYKGGDPGGV